MKYKIISNFSWVILSLKFFLLGIFSLIFSKFIGVNDWHFHSLFCLISLIISTYQLFKVFKIDFDILLYDFRLTLLTSYTFYFIIGAGVLTLGSIEDIESVMSRFSINAKDAMRIDSMNAIGISLALFVFTLSKPQILPKITTSIITTFNVKNNLKIIGYLSILGFSAKLYVIFNDLALMGNSVIISGIIRQISQILLAVVLLSTLYKGTYQKIIHNIAFLIAIFISIFGLLGFSKVEFIFPLVAFGVGTGIRKKSFGILSLTILIGFVLIQLVGGIIQYARMNQLESMSLSNRIEIIQSGFDAVNQIITSQSSNVSVEYSALARISYINAQSAAVHYYDIGNGSNDYKNLILTFIPRILYPNKPVMTDSGAELNYKMYGNDASSEGTGVFIDGYYNFGWIGLILFSIISGFILAQLSYISRIIYSKNYLIFYPFIFFGIFMAFRIDGTLISDYLGQFIIIVYTIIVLFLIKYFLHEKSA